MDENSDEFRFIQSIADMRVYGAEAAEDPDDAMETLNKVIVRAREIIAEDRRSKKPIIGAN